MATMLACILADTPGNRAWIAELLAPETTEQIGEGIFTPYAGSVAASCDNCQRPTWIGPEGRKLIETWGEADVEAVCLICSMILNIRRGARSLDDLTIIHLSDESAAE